MNVWGIVGVVLLLSTGLASGAWQSDSGIVSGLGGVCCGLPDPTVFQKDTVWYLISGDGSGAYTGFNWTGYSWQIDTGIVSGLIEADAGRSVPCVFQKDTTWYLISGESNGAFYGYNWTGSAWQSDPDIVNGLDDIGSHSAPCVFQKDTTWYLISGEEAGVFNGYNWTGSSWQSDSEIVSGLGDVGYDSNPCVFQKDTTWYLISGEEAGVFNGYNWTGSSWQSDSEIVSGLGDIGYNSAPCVFQKDAPWYLISGERGGESGGVFYGFNWMGYTPAPTSLSHTEGVFWVNHTWSAGTGYDTDSYNVSINGTWHNGTTNTYYNNTLTTYGDWSNITVYAYNDTYGLSAGYASEDVQLPYPVPAVPTGAGSTWDYYWVNHSWTEGSSYGIWCGKTDSYNVSINGTWYNGTTNTYHNNTGLPPHGWSNASIYAFNNTGGLNETYIYQHVQIANRNITITNTSDWDGWEGVTVYVDYDATDPDGDTPIFSCNRTDLFTDFNTTTGQGNWTSVGGTYYVDFGVSDGYGSTDNYTMTILVGVGPINLDHTMGDTWVNHTWSPGDGGLITDSYNVSINGTWYNGTTNTYHNNTGLPPHGWSNASIYAFNNTCGVSDSFVSEDTQMANQNITITNTFDWEGCVNWVVYVDYDATDPDGDTPIFSCNRTDLFTDFNTTTGQGNWTLPVIGTYYVDFGVSDGYGSTDNYTMTVNVSAYGDWVNYDPINCWYDIGWGSTPTVFQKDGTWYLISGAWDGTFYGFYWTGSDWQINSNIESGLGGVGENSDPTVFQKDGTWYLISGNRAGIFYGYKWVGSSWQSDTDIVSGLEGEDVGYGSSPTVFQKDGTWYLISGSHAGIFYGYKWVGSSWQSDTNIVSGLHLYGGAIYSIPTVFQKNGTWYLISGDYYGTFCGFNWTGSSWQDDPDIVDGLEDVGYDSTPTVFQKDGIGYLITGYNYGGFYAYRFCGSYWDIPTYILIKDTGGHIVKNAYVAIYDESNDIWIQKYIQSETGVLSVNGSDAPVGTKLQLMIRTFDGVFIDHKTIDVGYTTKTITIPIKYNIAVQPVDENNAPLHGVFVGVLEYAISDPQAWWGYDTYWGRVPITNCSGFYRCDLIAEKGGYQRYNATGLNWTQKSAMVKDYRHTIIMEKES